MLTKQLQRKELLQKNANKEPVSLFELIFQITWLLPSSDWSLSPQDQISFGLEDMLDLRILRALLFFLLLLSGDVESNPGPPKKGKMFDTVASVHTLLEPWKERQRETKDRQISHYTASLIYIDTFTTINKLVWGKKKTNNRSMTTLIKEEEWSFQPWIFQGSLPRQKSQQKKSRWKCLLIRWENFLFRDILAQLFFTESTGNQRDNNKYSLKRNLF